MKSKNKGETQSKTCEDLILYCIFWSPMNSRTRGQSHTLTRKAKVNVSDQAETLVAEIVHHIMAFEDIPTNPLRQHGQVEEAANARAALHARVARGSAVLSGFLDAC